MSPADQPVILLDPRSHMKRIPIPREFYINLADFRDLLGILFRNHLGCPKIISEEYKLEDRQGTVVLGENNWHHIAVPGAIIAMSMIFRRSDKIASHECPRCSAMIMRDPDKRRQVKW
ncbi:hypothetical protein BJX64DRAFT_137688 [Aspergillus heterothallicus]